MPKKLENLLRAEIDPAFGARARYIVDRIQKQKPRRVLDAGCGRGFYLNVLTHFSFIKEIHGFDANETYLRVARTISDDTRITIREETIYNLPYQNNYFDFIIVSEVLEHVKNDHKALRELYRVLRPGGTLIISVPNRDFPFLWDPLNWTLMRLFDTHINKNRWWLAGIWADHERLYVAPQLQKKVLNTGFAINKTKEYIHWCWPFTHFMLYGIGKNIVERFGITELNRFRPESQNRISSLLAFLARLPSSWLDTRIKINPSVTILLTAQK